MIATTQDDDLLDSAQVSAQLLGGRVKPRTIDSWRSPGRAQPLKFIRVGHRCLYRASDVRQFLAENTTAPKA
jgi:hypothetical protein